MSDSASAALPPFLRAPHRVMFAVGTVQVLAVMLFWLLELGGRQGLWGAPAWNAPATWLHATLMLYGVFPAFILGFLMTALPRWVSAPPLAWTDYVPPFFLLAGGWVSFYLGFLLTPLRLFGLLLAALALLWAAWPLWRAASVPAPVPGSIDRRHARAVIVALLLGVLGQVVQALGLAFGAPGWLAAGETIGVWLFLLPVFFIVSHRMVPFFTASVLRAYQPYRPMPLLWGVLAAWGGHALAVLLLSGSLQSSVLAVADGLAAALLLNLWWHWRGWRALRVPMLAVLHVALSWLVVGMLLQVAQDVGWLAPGLLPLHALTVGYCTSMLIGMATRVSRGHAGVPIDGDPWVWPLFLVFQLVPLLRLAGEAGAAHWSPTLLYLAAAMLWLVLFAIWAGRHLPGYWRPRADGQAG